VSDLSERQQLQRKDTKVGPVQPRMVLVSGVFAFPLSAKTEPELRYTAKRLAGHLREHPEADLADIGFSLTTTQALFERRAVVVGKDREALLGGLDALSRGENPAGAVAAKADAGKLAYLFSGQGAQRTGMGTGLYSASPLFAAAVDGICSEFDVHLTEPLKEIVFGAHPHASELLDRTEFAQPALFAFEVALYRLVGSLSLRPDYLIGHSIGEIVAAHVAGVLSLSDACKLVATRGRLIGRLPEGGVMLVVEASEQEACESIADRESDVSIAAVNGPRVTVIAGREATVDEVDEWWTKRGRKTTRLAVSHAFHSPLMDPMLAEFEAVVRDLDYAEPQIPIVSTLTGDVLPAEQAVDPSHWVRHVREAVRFAGALGILAERGVTTFLELGPDGGLGELAGAENLMRFLAAAHVAGHSVDWSALFPRGRRVKLPT